MPSRRAVAGFTLVELITALVLVSVLAGLAAPAFTARLQRMRMRAALDHLTSDLYRARAYAVAHGVRVTIRLRPAGRCAAAYVMRRADDGSVVDSVRLAAHADGVCITSNVQRAMSINSRGMLLGSPRVIRARSGAQVDSLTVSIVGRIYRWY